MNEIVITTALTLAKVFVGILIGAVIISALFTIVMIAIGETKHYNHRKLRRIETKERNRLYLLRMIEQDKLREEKEMDAYLSDISDGGNFANHMKDVCEQYHQAQSYIKGEDLTDDGVL